MFLENLISHTIECVLPDLDQIVDLASRVAQRFQTTIVDLVRCVRFLCEKRRHTSQRQRTAAKVMRAAGGIEAEVAVRNRGPSRAIGGP
jgi:hypothetical protein